MSLKTQQRMTKYHLVSFLFAPTIRKRVPNSQPALLNPALLPKTYLAITDSHVDGTSKRVWIILLLAARTDTSLYVLPPQSSVVFDRYVPTIELLRYTDICQKRDKTDSFDFQNRTSILDVHEVWSCFSIYFACWTVLANFSCRPHNVGLSNKNVRNV